MPEADLGCRFSWPLRRLEMKEDTALHLLSFAYQFLEPLVRGMTRTRKLAISKGGKSIRINPLVLLGGIGQNSPVAKLGFKKQYVGANGHFNCELWKGVRVESH